MLLHCLFASVVSGICDEQIEAGSRFQVLRSFPLPLSVPPPQVFFVVTTSFLSHGRVRLYEMPRLAEVDRRECQEGHELDGEEVLTASVAFACSSRRAP